MVERNIDHAAMLDVAIEEAVAGLSEGGIPIGAALFDRHGTLLGRGHNRRVQENDPSVHGETNSACFAIAIGYIACLSTMCFMTRE